METRNYYDLSYDVRLADKGYGHIGSPNTMSSVYDRRKVYTWAEQMRDDAVAPYDKRDGKYYGRKYLNVFYEYRAYLRKKKIKVSSREEAMIDLQIWRYGKRARGEYTDKDKIIQTLKPYRT